MEYTMIETGWLSLLILILSWSLGGVCRQLIGTGVYIFGLVSSAHLPLGFLPFLIFIVAALTSFSMGTSWSIFGMLIPVVTMICAADGAGALLIGALVVLNRLDLKRV